MVGIACESGIELKNRKAEEGEQEEEINGREESSLWAWREENES